MVPKLLQVKLDTSLKEKLQRIALSKGLKVTSYVRMTLIEAAERDDDEALSENGFSVREEKRLAKSFVEAKKLMKAGKLKKQSSAGAFLRLLNK